MLFIKKNHFKFVNEKKQVLRSSGFRVIEIDTSDSPVERIFQFFRTKGHTELISSTTNNDNFTSSFTNLRKSLLFEITGGFARIGPSVGARYVVNLEKEYNYWQFYAIWKF